MLEVLNTELAAQISIHAPREGSDPQGPGHF